MHPRWPGFLHHFCTTAAQIKDQMGHPGKTIINISAAFLWCQRTKGARMLRQLVERMSFYDDLKFDAAGLIPAIIQEHKTGRVLMMAWMNRASLEKTLETGKTHFWSRSRQQFWMKGETSGHTQTVKDV